jgi:hypothetical protein
MEALAVLLFIVVVLAGLDAAAAAWGTDSRELGLHRR